MASHLFQVYHKSHKRLRIPIQFKTTLYACDLIGSSNESLIDIGGWDVSSGTEFDIGGWNVAKGSNFFGMFRDATEFNQDLSSWDVSSANTNINMFPMFQDSAMPCDAGSNQYPPSCTGNCRNKCT
eukprot:scaffold47215_cov51-Attheya_sp.AAC.8